jgi:hypothetical protein
MAITHRCAVGLLVSFATLLAAAEPAAACSCHDGGPVCQAFWETPVVFVGRVVSVTPIKSAANGGPTRTTRFRVTEPLRGTTTPTIDLTSYSTSCDLFFAPGEDWIIYASPQHNGTGLATSTCSRSRLLNDAADDLAYARSVYSRTSDRGRIYGRLTASGSPRDVPVPGVRLTFHGPWFDPVYALTDKDGRYEVAAPAATYRISAALPRGMSFRSDHMLVELLDDRGCAEADLWAEHPATITGRVVTAGGAPIPNVTVEMLQDRQPAGSRLRGITDRQGRYEVAGLEPGSYVPAVASAWVRTDHRAVESRFLFPGGATLIDGVQPIKIEGGGNQSVADIVVPDAVRIAQVSGVVVHANGRPAAGVKVRTKADFDGEHLPWTTIRTDPRGRFTFAMAVGTRYRIVVDPAGPPRPGKIAAVVDPSQPPSPLKIVVP